MRKPSPPPAATRDRMLAKIDHSIDDLSRRLNQLYDRSLQLAVRTRKSFRPQSGTEADRYDALRRGLDAGRAATARIDAEIERLERQRDDLYERRAELDGRRAAPISFKDEKCWRLMQQLDRIRAEWQQHVERAERRSHGSSNRALERTLARLTRDATRLSQELDQLESEKRTSRKSIAGAGTSARRKLSLTRRPAKKSRGRSTAPPGGKRRQ